MALELEWVNLKARELRERAAQDAIAVLPIGSIEQHGPHLPVQVDSLLVGEVARRAARLMAETTPVVVLPTIWAGLAEHHMSLGGTLTLDLDTFFSLIRGIVRSAVRGGFKRLAILNGHGGNMTALNALVGELSVDLNVPILLATYWVPAQAEFARILEQQKTVLHACEAETSMLLALRPDLVDLSAIADLEAPREWEGGSGGVYRWQSVKSWSPSGVAGVPMAASAEKGWKLLNAAATAVAAQFGDARLWDHS